MKHMYQAFFGALLVFVLATPVTAGSRYDASCNCYRPDSWFQSKRVVHDSPRVVPGSRRVIEVNRVVPRTNVIDRNNLIVHVRPVIHKDVVVRRENVIYRNITVYRENNTHRVREQHRNVTDVQTVRGSVRTVNEVRHVKGRDCNCGGTTREYSGERLVSSRY
jgi:hypothetical protein